MPLLIAALESGLEAVAASPPETSAECADLWAAAVQAWAAGIVPPSTTVTAAAEALAGSLAVAFATTAAAPLMETAFATFAASVGGGMAGYVPTPPVAPVGFATEFAEPFPETHSEAAANVANLVDSWMRTGLSTLAAPPGTVVPWS